MGVIGFYKHRAPGGAEHRAPNGAEPARLAGLNPTLFISPVAGIIP